MSDNGSPRYDNRTGQQRFLDALVVGKQDVNFLTEKALNSIFNGDPRRKGEIEVRCSRLYAMIDMVKDSHIVLRDMYSHMATELNTMHTDVRAAMSSLCSFLETLLTMPMADETRVAIEDQLSGIRAAIAQAAASGPSRASETSRDHGREGSPAGRSKSR